MKNILQILEIAWAEFRFGLKRGAPVVTTLLIGLILGAGLLLGPLSNLSIAKDNFTSIGSDPVRMQKLAGLGFTLDSFRKNYAESMGEMTVLSLPLAWPILMMSVFLFLPAAAAASIPADRKFGVAELLHSLPITGGTYLAGKTLGFLAAVILCGCLTLGLFLAVLEGFLLANFGAGLPPGLIWFYIKFSLFDVLPLILWAVMIGTLVSIPFRSRRAAVFPGLLAGIVSGIFWLPIFNTGFKVWPATQLDLNAYYLIQNYHSTALDALARATGAAQYFLFGPDAPVVGIGRVISRAALLVGSLLVAGTLGRFWMYWKENF
jgi:ABC-type transport system involved in multi-copper enzyme maturation permease subunit